MWTTCPSSWPRTCGGGWSASPTTVCTGIVSIWQDDCWIEQMRDRAAEAQVLITNHHLLLNALELGRGGERILPPAAIYVVDEAHQLEETATAVFETTVTDFTVEQLLARAIFKEYADEVELDELRFQNTVAFQEVAYQSRENSYRIKGALEEMKRLGHDLEKLKETLKALDPFKQYAKETLGGPKDKAIPPEIAAKRGQFEKGLEALASIANKLLTVASDKRDDAYVRFATRIFNRRKVTLEVHAAPIAPAALLRDYPLRSRPGRFARRGAAHGDLHQRHPLDKRPLRTFQKPLRRRRRKPKGGQDARPRPPSS